MSLIEKMLDKRCFELFWCSSVVEICIMRTDWDPKNPSGIYEVLIKLISLLTHNDVRISSYRGDERIYGMVGNFLLEKVLDAVKVSEPEIHVTTSNGVYCR